MKRKNLSPGALTAPLPPVLVTVGEGDDANILTIAWTGILSTIPPKTYISVRPRRYSYKILEECLEFVINLPTAEMAKKVDYCGIYTGAKVDKFKECGFTKAQSKEVKAPTLAECPIALECRVCDTVLMGTHRVFIADIVSVSCREDIIDEAGKLRFDKADLLAYAHGEYYRLGEKLGAFGFSTDKKDRNIKGKSESISPKAKSEKTDTPPHESGKNHSKAGKDTETNQENTRQNRAKSPTYNKSGAKSKKTDNKAAGGNGGGYKSHSTKEKKSAEGKARGRFSTFAKQKRS